MHNSFETTAAEHLLTTDSISFVVPKVTPVLLPRFCNKNTRISVAVLHLWFGKFSFLNVAM